MENKFKYSWLWRLGYIPIIGTLVAFALVAFVKLAVGFIQWDFTWISHIFDNLTWLRAVFIVLFIGNGLLEVLD